MDRSVRNLYDYIHQFPDAIIRIAYANRECMKTTATAITAVMMNFNMDERYSEFFQ